MPKENETLGHHTSLDVDRILRVAVRDIRIPSRNDLELDFSNGCMPIVHDDPETISWWFYKYATSQTLPEDTPLEWHVSGIESDTDL